MKAAPAQPFAGDPTITAEVVQEHGLKPEEYTRIQEILGREPTFTELGVFSALWSEHCAYKHSRPVLRAFPVEGDQVLQGPGENAGVVRVGDGWAVAFKMESHNHPTAVEPYQGAATGVGGILRDVFTMGARPMALLNSLRFGPLSDPHNRYLFGGAVRGIGDYGNCVGIPTVGGEVAFAESYGSNPLVNAMCVGLLRETDLMRAVASGVGNELIAVGARTGRDGIHGASFASEELSEDSEARRPQVQVGDPFTEKLLMEASLELIASGHIVGIQDMGAAGLTSSAAEMAARGGVGVVIDTALVPVREPDMTPYEVLLSESQERMLVVGREGHLEPIRAIAEKWELEAELIGHVTDDGLFRVVHAGRTVVEIPGSDLVERAPVYHPEAEEDPAIAVRRDGTGPPRLPEPEQALDALLDTPALASKRWVFEQYDSTVRASTIVGPGGDGGVIRIPGTTRGVAVATDGNSRYVLLDPYEGGKAAVAECARNVAATGARPLGITNCLNFGSPERPSVFYQFRESCRGIADACRAFNTPVTGGNVSFYNERNGAAIDPTPIIGMVGVIARVADVMRADFRQPGDAIVLLGEMRGHLGGSALWAFVGGAVEGSPPPVDLEREAALIEVLVRIAEAGFAHSCHDLSDGGFALALAEACVGGPYAQHPYGADVNLRSVEVNGELATWFGEDHGRALLSVAESDLDALIGIAGDCRVPAHRIGTVGVPNGEVRIRTSWATRTLDSTALRRRWLDAIPRRMQTPVNPEAGV